MDKSYLRQAELVVRCLPSIAVESCFALKGGTALNLFELDLPRLSVDIDLTFLPVTGRETAVAEINAALSRIVQRLQLRGVSVRTRGTEVSRKIVCSSNGAEIKIEPNYILRGAVFPVRRMEVTPQMAKLVGVSAEMAILSRQELYGGKFCAALDRQHPRELFDVAQFFGREGSVRDVKDGFLAMALGHNRPLHELLAPHPLDQRATFASQFAGMSDVPFSVEEHEAAFRRLVGEIGETLTAEDWARLVAFTALEAGAEVFGIPGLERLPAIQWKRKNLETLRERDPKRFSENTEALKRVFGG